MFTGGLKFGDLAGKVKCAVAKLSWGRCGSDFVGRWAWVAQLVERVLGKDEVTGSIPVPGSSFGEWEGLDSGRAERG